VVLAIVTMLSEPLLHHIEALDHHRDGIWSPSLPHCYDVLAIPVAGLRAALEPAAGPLERLLAANHRMQRRIATFETGLDEGALEAHLEGLRTSALEARRLDLTLAGFAAAVAQHETDHLDGILFVQRMPFAKRQMLAGKLRALRKRAEEESVAG